MSVSATQHKILGVALSSSSQQTPVTQQAPKYHNTYDGPTQIVQARSVTVVGGDDSKMVVQGIETTVIESGNARQLRGEPIVAEFCYTKHNLGERYDHFVGRGTYFDTFDRNLPKSSQIIVGQDGVGKTTLVHEYAYCKLLDGTYKLAWMIDASSTDTMVADILALGRHLELDADGRSDADQCEYIKGWLGRQRQVLLIFDNVTNYLDYSQYLPGGTIHILATSRNMDMPNKVILDVFSQDDVVAYFDKVFGSEHIHRYDDIDKLQRTLHSDPKSIHNAVRRIHTRSRSDDPMTIQAYLEQFHPDS